MKTQKTIVVLIAIVVVAGAAYLMWPKAAQTTDAPATSDSASPLTVTQGDNGKTFEVKKGDRFVLALGEMDWTISISDTSIISRVKNLAMIRGAQGVYTADKVGTTVISAEGRPICNTGEMCAQYIINWTANIIVR